MESRHSSISCLDPSKYLHGIFSGPNSTKGAPSRSILLGKYCNQIQYSLVHKLFHERRPSNLLCLIIPGMRHYLGIMMSPPQETDEWSFQNFSNGFKQVMLTHPQFNDIGKALIYHKVQCKIFVTENEVAAEL